MEYPDSPLIEYPDKFLVVEAIVPVGKKAKSQSNQVPIPSTLKGVKTQKR